MGLSAKLEKVPYCKVVLKVEIQTPVRLEMVLCAQVSVKA